MSLLGLLTQQGGVPKNRSRNNWSNKMYQDEECETKEEQLPKKSDIQSMFLQYCEMGKILF